MLLPGGLHLPSFWDSILSVLFLESSRDRRLCHYLACQSWVALGIYLNFMLFLGSFKVGLHGSSCSQDPVTQSWCCFCFAATSFHVSTDDSSKFLFHCHSCDIDLPCGCSRDAFLAWTKSFLRH